MEDLEIKVNRKLVYKESTEDLGNLKSNKFSTKEEKRDFEYIYVTNIDKTNFGLDATEIEISELKKMIAKAEKAGANFISIDFHCDHGEYDIYGLKISRTSLKDLNREKKNKAKIESIEKKEKIEKLEAQLKKLKV